MKKILLSFFIISTAFVGKGQNLVPNGDFEQYSSCPTAFGEIDLALFWMNPASGSPDYYNQCSNAFNVDVPDNFWGYQPARSGNAYSGIYIWVSAYTAREYIEAHLTSTLIAGNCYHFEMYINLPNSCRYTTDAIGVYFSDTAVTGVPNFDPLPLTPQINNTAGNIPDTLNWVLASGNYTASGGENYLIIGNFKDDASTNAILINNSGSWPGAYFLIDDVSLTPCTGISEQTQTEAITIYPNPVKDELFIKGYPVTGKTEIIITDVLGKQVYRNQIPNSKFQIPTSGFRNGIYFIEINEGTKTIRKKFVKESVK